MSNSNEKSWFQMWVEKIKKSELKDKTFVNIIKDMISNVKLETLFGNKNAEKGHTLENKRKVYSSEIKLHVYEKTIEFR